MPVTLELLISTLASNKASPLGASLYNTYKNITYQPGAGGCGRLRVRAREAKIFFLFGPAQTSSMYVGGESAVSK